MPRSLLDRNIYRTFTRLYLLALAAVAFLSVLGQVLVQQMLNRQAADSWIINHAGRQRFQSQAIVKSVLVLARPGAADTGRYLAELRLRLASWTAYHHQLKSGRLDSLPARLDNSPVLKRLYADLEPHFQAIRSSARRIVGLAERPSAAPAGALAREAATVLAHEGPFLAQMDGIVSRYEHEARAKVSRLRRIELGLLVLTVSILVLEALLVFKPAVTKLRQTVLALITAESQAREMNEELKSLNQSLEETREELLAATQRQYQQQAEDQRVRTAYLIQGQEEERKRLARDLHDGLGQLLTALKLGIENLDEDVEKLPKEKKKLDDLKQLVAHTIAEVRTISFNLMPSVLNDFGVASALRLLTAQMAKTATAAITFTTNLHDERFVHETETTIYRIAQESLNNAVKYAGAGTIRVQLTSRRRQLHLLVADDGVGFPYRELQRKSQQTGVFNGLNHIQERARLVGGELTVVSAPGQGTRVQVSVPVQTLKTP